VNLQVKTLDGQEVLVTLNERSQVKDLKEALEERTGIPVERQRILSQGKVLSDLRNLNSGEVFLVAHLQRDDDLNSVLAQLLLLRNLRMYRRMRRLPGHFPSSSEVHEALIQNARSIRRTLRSSRELVVGEWVDVEDTVGQWLEAQVIQVARGRAFIHYNNWPAHWDEWIHFESPRIQPFRSRTVQPINSGLQSPYPTYSRQVEALESPEFLDVYRHGLDFVYRILKMGERYKRAVQTQSEQDLRELSAFAGHIDRMGRFLSDLGKEMSRNSRLQVPVISQGNYLQMDMNELM